MKWKKANPSKTGQSLASASVIGILVASVLSLLLSVLISTFVLRGSLQENSIHISVFMIRLISSLLAVLIAGALLRKNYLPLAGIITGGYLLMFIAIGLALYNGNLRYLLSGVTSVLIGSIIAILILQKPKKIKGKSAKYSL